MKTALASLPPSALVFAGTTLASLVLAAVSFIGWMNARNEAAMLRTEVRLAQGTAQDAEQQLEALRIINRRQLEIIRESSSQARGAAMTP